MERHLLITEELLRGQLSADVDAEGGGVDGVAPGGRRGSAGAETRVADRTEAEEKRQRRSA
jgi:hypothetical protein